MGIKSYLFLKALEYRKKQNAKKPQTDEPLDVIALRKGLRDLDRFISKLRRIRKDVTVLDIEFAGMPCYHAIPDHKTDRVILFLHGGGYISGLAEMASAYRGFSAELAHATKAELFAIEYRLAPEHPFPAAIEDAERAYVELLERGIKPQDLFVAGDSAGGGLAIALLMKLRDDGIPLPAASIPISPWTDLAMTGGSLTTRAEIDPLVSNNGVSQIPSLVLAGQSATNPYISPHYGSFKGLPPMMVFVGGREVLYDDSARVVEKAKAEGVDATLDVVEHMIHVYPTMVGIFKEGPEAIKRMAAFVEKHHKEFR